MNIVIGVDGTLNSTGGGASYGSNVEHLFNLLQQAGEPATYLAGVGREYGETDYLAWVHRSRRLPRLAAAALAAAGGLGTGIRIRKAYKTLCESYAGGRNNIFLFGFSRGAFAIRALVGFVDAVGLLLSDKATIQHVELAYQLYCDAEDPDHSVLQEFLFRVTGKSRPAEGDQLRVCFVGVWDTVAALGMPWMLGRLSRVSLGDLEAVLPANVSHARQALSLHDLRSMFRPVLWRGTHPDNQNQTLRQVWFAGDHSNVGGGRETREQSDRSLEWMIVEARAAGLHVPDAATVPYSARSPLN